MSEHADTIREALGIREWAASITPSSYGEKVEAETPAGFAALAALEAELAEARASLLTASPGCELIAVERQRQIDVEGWTPEHDDGHADGYLAEAAAALILNDETLWPWPDYWKDEDDPKRRLVKAGALIAAELDRIHRAALASGSEGDADG